MGDVNTPLIRCAMCGFEYDPAQHRACGSCPLQKGCEMVCCPACGYQSVDVHKSVLARLADSLFSFFIRKPSNPYTWPGNRAQTFPLHRAPLPAKRVELTLVDVPPGSRARLAGFLDGLPVERRVQLQAYGLVANDWVHVLQQAPVTVIRIDHTELALEGKLAGQIKVERIGPEKPDEDR